MIPRQELERVMRAKAAMVHDLGQRIDLRAFVVHHRDGDHVATMHAVGGEDEPGQVLPLLSTRLACAGFRTDELTLIAEVNRRRTDQKPTGASALEGDGSLEREFAYDPFTDVEEALLAVYVRRGVDYPIVLSVPFTYTDHGGVIAVAYGVIEGPERGDGPRMRRLVDAVNLAEHDPAHELWRAVAETTHGCSPHVVAEAVCKMFDHGMMLVER